jgi:hypothetical protein
VLQGLVEFQTLVDDPHRVGYAVVQLPADPLALLGLGADLPFLGQPALALLLGPLALGYVHKYVHRPEKFTRLIVDWVGVGKRGEALAVRALDNDLVAVVFVVHLERQCHPTLVVGDRRSVRPKKLEGAAEAVHGVVQLRCTPPKLHRMLVKVGDQPFRVAGVRSRGQLLQKAMEP